MTFKQYIDLSSRTDAVLGEQRDQHHWLLGTYNEFGEFIGPIKKALVKNTEPNKDLLQDELGDVCWYLSKGCRVTNFVPEDTFAYVIKDSIIELIKEFNEAWNNENIMHLLCILLNVCELYELDFEKSLEINLAKLQARHPQKFNIDNEKHSEKEIDAIREASAGNGSSEEAPE